MEYTEFTDELDGSKHIILDLGDGAYKSFPADPENPEYVAFLKQLEAESAD